MHPVVAAAVPAAVSYAPLETPIGRLWLAGSDHGLLAIAPGQDPDLLLREVARRRRGAAIALSLDPGPVAPALVQLEAYFAGRRRRSFRLVLDLAGTPTFDAAVWRAVMAIGYGSTASYGDVAAAIGSPRAARAVGGALHRCPLFPVVPCHRVIHADGSIGGWGGDAWVKPWLLANERRGPRATRSERPRAHVGTQ